MKVPKIKVASKLRSSTQVMVSLVVVWVFTFLLHERLMPYLSIRSCQWPHIDPRAEEVVQQGDQEQDSVASREITNVMLIADPQLIDNHTYPGRNELLLRISKHTADAYLRRNYNALMKHLAPKHLFFLGDYLDNGRSASEAYFKSELRRFKSIFHRFKRVKKHFNVAGNHDIGWADGVKMPSRKRFKKYFASPNAISKINNVDFIMLDTSSLSSSNEEISKDSREFLERNFGSSIVKSNPHVLLSHVPLYRDTTTHQCGAMRESSVFSLGSGYQYQSALQPELSRELLEKVKPDLIFSGDDHDYCDIHHEEIDGQDSREITVKSMSMAMGIRYPAVQLLSFAVDQDSETLISDLRYETRICYLQRPFVNIAVYVVLAIVSAAVVFWTNARAHPSRYSYSLLPHLNSTVPMSSTVNTMSPSSNSKKIDKFLREQEDSSASPSGSLAFRNYTSSTQGSRLPKLLKLPKLPKLPKKLAVRLKAFHTFMIKWNAYASIRHCFMLGTAVVSVYYFCFYLTL